MSALGSAYRGSVALFLALSLVVAGAAPADAERKRRANRENEAAAAELEKEAAELEKRAAELEKKAAELQKKAAEQEQAGQGGKKKKAAAAAEQKKKEAAEAEKAATEKKPVATEKKPAATEKKPVAAEPKKPAAAEKAPVAEEKKAPAAVEKAPVAEEKKAPAAVEKAPVADEKKAPAATKKAPAAADKAPVAIDETPVAEELPEVTKPVGVEKAPGKAPAPVPARTVTGDAKIPPPGAVVSRTNVSEYESVLGPGLSWAVDRGAKLRVGAYKKIPHPPLYAEATEKFSSQVRLSGDGMRLENYVAGMPFPTVDKSDPRIADKLMFNFSTAIGIDDSDIRNFDCDTGTLGKEGKPTRVERHFLIDHIRRLYFTGRLEVDPKPAMPNRDSARFKEALYPLVEPFDLKGTGFTFTRYLDHTRQDDTWLYLPQLRRVRRLSSAQRSDALFGQDTDADSFEGYQGNIAWMSWKFLGEKTVLGTMHAEHLPVQWSEPSGDFMHDDVWEPREVWIIEGVSKLPQYAYGKRVIYLDKEIHRIPFTDMYDSAGELWKMWVNNYRFAKAPYKGARYSMDWEYGYRPSITMIDVQLEHGTFCALPSHRFPGEQGWYINLGDKEGTTEEFFDLSAIIAAGRG